jgi:hypothetical protein
VSFREMLSGYADFYRRRHELERLACVGHASVDEADPEALSRERAQAVCHLLEELGVSPPRLVVRAAGGRAGSEEGEAARQRARNVTLVVVMYSGQRIARWDGHRMLTLSVAERYRAREEPPTGPPPHPICPLPSEE